MRTGADQDALIIAALAEDSPAAWEAFLRWASGPVWSACLHSSARRSAAEKLFAELTETLFEHRLDLPGRFAASRLGAAAAFLISEIDEYIGARIADGFRRGDHAAAEIFARYFHGEIKTWIQRATPPGERVRIEDRVQDVYAILLENDGRRLAAYPGGGSFRVFLRRLTLNASTDCQRREQGRFRLKAAIEKLSPLERKAYRLLYESRLSRNEAIARLGDPLAAAAVKVADALGELRVGGRWRAAEDDRHRGCRPILPASRRPIAIQRLCSYMLKRWRCTPSAKTRCSPRCTMNVRMCSESCKCGSSTV